MLIGIGFVVFAAVLVAIGLFQILRARKQFQAALKALSLGKEVLVIGLCGQRKIKWQNHSDFHGVQGYMTAGTEVSGMQEALEEISGEVLALSYKVLG